MNEWKVTWQIIGGEKYFQVYRIKDPSDIDHAGNRFEEIIYIEYVDDLFKSESLAQEQADRLNGKLKEDKAAITKALLPVLQMTRHLEDLTDLEYVVEDNKEEYVIATFKNGYTKRMYVTGDSGYALIKDVIWPMN